MSKLLDEIPHWLAHHAQPARSSCYPSWTCFLKTFLRQGQTTLFTYDNLTKTVWFLCSCHVSDDTMIPEKGN